MPRRMVTLLPRPRLMGTSPETCHRKPNSGTLVRRKKSRAHSRSMACAGATLSGPSVRVTVSSLCRARAIPRQSKPGPMFEVLPGTLMVTDAGMGHETVDGAGCKVK